VEDNYTLSLTLVFSLSDFKALGESFLSIANGTSDAKAISIEDPQGTEVKFVLDLESAPTLVQEEEDA
jgi:hypothetical protein